MSPGTAPGLAIIGLAHRHSYPKLRIACFELGDLLSKNEVARGPETENQVHDSRPSGFSEIPCHTHHRRNSYTAANQQNAVSVLSCKIEGSAGRLDFDFVARYQIIMQPT